MKRYDIYYATKDKRIEKKNVSQDEMQSFLDSLHEKDEPIILGDKTDIIEYLKKLVEGEKKDEK